MTARQIVSDELLLKALQWRSEGGSTTKIARELGVSVPYVRAMTNRVRLADLAESGERPEVVALGYWVAT